MSSKLALSGTSETIAEFFRYSIMSILYLRNVYDEKDFEVVEKYGLRVYTSRNKERITAHIHTWLTTHALTSLVLVILSRDTRQPLERWEFSVDLYKPAHMPTPTKDIKQQTGQSQSDISAQIAALLRQINATTSFLPILPLTTFNILAFTNKTAIVNEEWADSDPMYCQGEVERVRLREVEGSGFVVGSAVEYAIPRAL